MSSARLNRSFSLIRPGKALSSKAVSKYPWPFDASDLSVMHGDYGILQEMGGVHGLAGALRTDLKKGIYHDEVEEGTFAERNAVFGINVFEKPPLRTFWEHCKEQLEDPMLIVLIVAGAVSVIVGTIDAPDHGWTEGVAILIAVCLVTFVGAFNNRQQDLQFRKLENENKEETYRVTRDGTQIRISQSQIVVGDVVELQAGDAVPADGILIYGDDCYCNEAKMTGENLDIPKNNRKPFLLAGTEVRRGQLEMIVVGVGNNSSYGRIMAALAQPVEQTPLQEKLEKIATLVGYIGGGVAVLLFFSLFFFFVADDNKSFSDDSSDILDFFITAVTIVVVAVPEGLPLAVTISLAYSMGKMRDDNNLVRILSACETMGNATTICSDKTGTLTLNQMTVMKGWLAGTAYDKLNDTPDLPEFVRNLLVEGVIVNSQSKEEVEEGTHKKVWSGNQTEISLMKWLIKHEMNIEEERNKYIVAKNYPFDSMKKNSSIIIRVGNKWRRYYKGASEQIVAGSDRILDAKNNVVEMSMHKREVDDTIDRMTKTGLRTIGFAYQDYDHIDTDPSDPNKLVDPPETDEGFVFFGVVGIKDPLRPESRASVRSCQRAGVVVRMVTGDHLETAKYIARDAGILTADHHVAMTGAEFRVLLNSKEAENVIPNLRVLARSKPEDKQVLVKWLKDHGQVVAATGDGTNDAPALKEAHVGIAMNIEGTAVAKSAAEILILDDNFASIVKSILWGRSVFDNIRKFVQFQLTVNVVALSISLIGVYTGVENPLTAVQLLWVNLIMDTMAALALGTESPSPTLLNRRPYTKDAPLISMTMWRNILMQSAYQLIWLMIIMYVPQKFFSDVVDESTEHLTLIFNTFVWLQVFNEINSRKCNSNEHNVFEKFFENWIFTVILIVTAFFQFLMVQFFGSFADTTGLDAGQWFFCIGIGATCLIFGVIVRLVPMDDSKGMVDIPDDTFAGANLDRPDDEEPLSSVTTV